MRTTILPSLFALSLAVLVTASGCSRPAASEVSAATSSQAIEVRVAAARQSQICSTLELVGTLLPIRATTIVSDVDGIIESFPASDRVIEYEEAGRTASVALGLDIGHEVKDGQVIVQLERTDFQLALDAAQANLDLAKADLAHLTAWKREEEVAQIQAQLNEATAAVFQAQADLSRSAELLAQNAISPSTHGTFVMAEAAAVAAQQQAAAGLQMATNGPTAEELAVAEARVRMAEAEVAMKQQRVDKATIRAPYDAVVSERYVDVGDRVTAMPRVEILEVIDPRMLLAQVSVPEKYQGAVRLDDMVEVRAGGVERPLPGRVDLVNAKVDPSTRTFRVRVSIDNRSRVLKAGGFVRVVLPVASSPETVVVPSEAVALSEGRHTVFVYDEGRVRRRTVAVGISCRTEQEIVEGLTPGEPVVVSGTSLLADGVSVRLAEAMP